MTEKSELELTGTYQNIELAIIEAMHLLAPFSEFGDESCRCKEIHNLVRNAAIEINGVVQQGKHRFTLFSSALCGRRSSQKLFQQVAHKERPGAWWKLKVPYEQAVQIATGLLSRHSQKFNEDEQIVSQETLIARRDELVRSKFMSLIPVVPLKSEISAIHDQLQERNRELIQFRDVARSDASPQTLQLVNEFIQMRRRLERIRQNSRDASEITPAGVQMFN